MRIVQHIVIAECFLAVLIFALASCDRSPIVQSPLKEPLISAVDTNLDNLVRGKKLFRQYGCHLCHGENADRGIKNANNQTGGVIVGLTRVAEGFKKAELAKKILEGVWNVPRAKPQGPIPPYRMPGWKGHISEKDLSDLIDYLVSLMPKGAEDDW